MRFSDLMQPLLELRELAPHQASELMAFLLDGHATEAQIGAIIAGLRIKGATGNELATFATELRSRAKTLDLGADVVDTCGTGGGIPTFNLSTAAAFVAAGAGVPIAKHGNRAVSSNCGSADVLEKLGAKLQDDLSKLERIFRACGIVFMFAPVHHPGMRHVGKPRKELGFRSVFNQLGPLANPAHAKRQLIGTFGPELVAPMAQALATLGAERALVVHGQDGMDEISPCGPTHAGFVLKGEVRIVQISPDDFGLEEIDAEALIPGETIEENAAILKEAISDIDSSRARALLPCAAAAIWLDGQADDLSKARERAEESIRSGAALAKLNEFVQACEVA